MRRLIPLLCLALVVGCSSGGGDDKPPVAWHGIEPVEKVTRPQWVLRDTSGNVFDFQKETRGRPTFVYFGYTHCPDECPTAMADIAAALRRTPQPLREKVKVVLVTTDPKRDTGPVLRRWLDQFSTDFIGVLGTQAEIDAAQDATGATPARPQGVAPTLPGRPDAHPHKEGTAAHEHYGPLGYAVAHSAVIFAYDASDRMPVIYPGGVTPADIAADLPALAST